MHGPDIQWYLVLSALLFAIGALGVMLRRSPLNREIRFPQLQDESFRRLEAAVEEQRTDQCLDDIADDILALAGAVLACLLAEANEGGDSDLAAVLGAGFAVDERVIALGKIALGLFGITLVERSSDDHPKHSVAEELQSFVIRSPNACMRDRKLEEAQVLRLVTELVADEGGEILAHCSGPV